MFLIFLSGKNGRSFSKQTLSRIRRTTALAMRSKTIHAYPLRIDLQGISFFSIWQPFQVFCFICLDFLPVCLGYRIWDMATGYSALQQMCWRIICMTAIWVLCLPFLAYVCVCNLHLGKGKDKNIRKDAIELKAEV